MLLKIGGSIEPPIFVIYYGLCSSNKKHLAKWTKKAFTRLVV